MSAAALLFGTCLGRRWRLSASHIQQGEGNAKAKGTRKGKGRGKRKAGAGSG